MPNNRYHGKVIVLVEGITKKQVRELALEATAFASVKDYARALCKTYHLGREFVIPITRTLRYYAKETWGEQWCKDMLDIGGKYIQIASRDLGVHSKDVVIHLRDNAIDIRTWCARLFPGSGGKAYSFFYMRIHRNANI